MKVGFAGTPDFARTALEALVTSAHRVCLVMTQPDRPSGRGQHLSKSAVKQFSELSQIPVFQPQSLRLVGPGALEAEAMHETLRAERLDVLVVAAYGLILPQSVLNIPRLGCLNIHASLLPRWRGAAPIQRAIEAGDRTTGVTIMQMEAGLDTGPMIVTREIDIGARSAAELTPLLARLGAEALIDVLDDLETGPLRSVPQPPDGVTYASKVQKTEARLDLTLDAHLLERRIRAFDPAPGAHLLMGPEPLKIWSAAVVTASGAAPPGTVLEVDGAGVVIACGQNALRLLVVQAAGGRRQPAPQVAARVHLRCGDRVQ